LIKKNIIKSFIAIVIPLLIITSCIDNFNRDLDTIYYNPSYSLPIGPLSYTLDEIMPANALMAYFTDSTWIPDTSDVLIYDDSFYFINPPFGYDTVYTEPFNLQSMLENSEYIVSVMFRANITNGLPVNTTIQVYLSDAAGTITDSVYAEGPILVESATIDHRDSVIYPHYTTIDTPLDSVQIQNLLESSGIDLYLHLATFRPENDTLHVYSYQYFEAQLGVRVELKVPL